MHVNCKSNRLHTRDDDYLSLLDLNLGSLRGGHCARYFVVYINRLNCNAAESAYTQLFFSTCRKGVEHERELRGFTILLTQHTTQAIMIDDNLINAGEKII